MPSFASFNIRGLPQALQVVYSAVGVVLVGGIAAAHPQRQCTPLRAAHVKISLNVFTFALYVSVCIYECMPHNVVAKLKVGWKYC